MMATQSSQEAIKAISKAVFEKYGATENKFSSGMKRLFSTLGISLSFDPLTGVPEISFNSNLLSKQRHLWRLSVDF